MSTFHVNNEADLKRSIAAWKGRLNKAQVELKATQKATEEALRRVQMAKSMLARRRGQLRKITNKGRRKAVTLALHYVGTKESPPNSNRGTRVDHWERNFGMIAQPWCGAFVGSMVNAAGGKVGNRIVYTPYIYTDATTGANGLSHVAWSRLGGFTRGKKAQAGDLVLYDFGSGGIKHVGMLRADWFGVGPLLTVEGNTSFGTAGSQDNGGAVAMRSRDRSLVHSIVVVRWP
jgi:hypothetical protein